MSATIDLDLEPARELAREVATRLADVRLPDVHLSDVRMPDVRLPDVHLPDVRMPDVRLPDVRMPDVHLSDLRMPDVHLSDLRLPDVAGLWAGASSPAPKRGRWLALVGALGVAAVAVALIRRRRRGPTIASTRPASSTFGTRPAATTLPVGSDVANLVDDGSLLPPPFLGNDDFLGNGDPGRLPVG